MSEEADHITEIMSFVWDSLQVVSYKWLSRKFSISANAAKSLLQIISERHGDNLEVIYAISGWSKEENRYTIQLVPKSKLQEAKDMIDGHVSIHVYSVQPALPKDSAEIWSAEYVQSEELFKQPPELDNCLRDNRFSAISCASINCKRLGRSSKGAARSSMNGGDWPSSTEMMVGQPNRSESGLMQQNLLGPTSSESKISRSSTTTTKAELCVPEPKKRKTVNARIDDYSREVTEVLWEDEDIVTRDEISLKTGGIDLNNSVESSRTASKRSTTHAKSLSNKSSGKGPLSKDSSQGKISSFFKKA